MKKNNFSNQNLDISSETLIDSLLWLNETDDDRSESNKFAIREALNSHRPKKNNLNLMLKISAPTEEKLNNVISDIELMIKDHVNLVLIKKKSEIKSYFEENEKSLLFSDNNNQYIKLKIQLKSLNEADNLFIYKPLKTTNFHKKFSLIYTLFTGILLFLFLGYILSCVRILIFQKKLN